MFLIRASFLLLVAFLFVTRCDEGAGEDRIGTILSMMADMRTHVGSLTESVKKIEQNEGDVAKKVEIIVKNEGEMSKKVEQLVQNEGDIAKKVGNIENRMAQLETKVDNVDNDVHISWFNWKFIGHGHQGSCSGQVTKSHTTLQECVAFCAKKRQYSGAKWNGLWWYVPNGECGCNENETGHTESANHLHFRM